MRWASDGDAPEVQAEPATDTSSFCLSIGPNEAIMRRGWLTNVEVCHHVLGDPLGEVFTPFCATHQSVLETMGRVRSIKQYLAGIYLFCVPASNYDVL